MTLPESICQAVGLKPNDRVEWRVEQGEIRGRKLVAQMTKTPFPRGSLFKYLTPERAEEQLAILSSCVIKSADLFGKRGHVTLERRGLIRRKIRDIFLLSATD